MTEHDTWDYHKRRKTLCCIRKERYAKKKNIAQSAEANLGVGSHVGLPLTQSNNMPGIAINQSAELPQSKDIKRKKGIKRKIHSFEKSNEALTSHQIPFTDENIDMINIHNAES